VPEGACIDLAHGLLAPAECVQIFDHLKNCSACASLFREVAAERERLRTSQRSPAHPSHATPASTEATDVPEWGDEPEAEIPPRASAVQGRDHEPTGERGKFRTGSTGRTRLLVWGSLAAAAAAAIVFVTLRWNEPTIPPPSWLPRPNASLESRGVPDEQGDLALGLGAYASRDLDQAIERLSRARGVAEYEIMRRTYLANAYAQKGRFDMAVESLEGVELRALPEPWNSETRWTLYYALRQVGQRARADSLRQILERAPGEIGERARAAR